MHHWLASVRPIRPRLRLRLPAMCLRRSRRPIGVRFATKAASKIAEFSLPSLIMAKEAVNRSYETTLSEGLRFERRLFHSMFALEDQKEGMAAFSEKRPARFKNR